MKTILLVFAIMMMAIASVAQSPAEQDSCVNEGAAVVSASGADTTKQPMENILNTFAGILMLIGLFVCLAGLVDSSGAIAAVGGSLILTGTMMLVIASNI